MGTIRVEPPARQAWAAFVEEHPRATIFHTPEMVDVFTATPRHEPFVLAAHDERGRVIALVVAVRVSTLPGPTGPFAARSILYAEPLARDTAQARDALRSVVHRLDERMRRRTLFSEVRMIYPATQALNDALVEAGYEYEPHLNLLVDLRRSPDERWGDLKRQCRQNIRRAQENGVEIVHTTSTSDVDRIYALMVRTFEHARVPLADRRLFVAAFDRLAPMDRIRGVIVRHRGRDVAASVFLLFRDRMYHWYQGVERIPRVHVAEAGIWDAMNWGHEHGFAVYDWGGAGDPRKPYGPRVFKTKFGGEQVEFGRYRREYSRVRVRMATMAYEALRGLPGVVRRSKAATRPSDG